VSNEEVSCKDHPDAPHGFCRDLSHTYDRYVCECEFWEPEEPKTYTQSDLEAAVLAEREAIASWYETTGYFLDEGDVAATIRARSSK